MASIIEIAYCWPVFNEDDAHLAAELWTALSNYKVTREQVVRMDLYFYDLFRLCGQTKTYLGHMKQVVKNNQSQIRRSLCVYNLRTLA